MARLVFVEGAGDRLLAPHVDSGRMPSTVEIASATIHCATCNMLICRPFSCNICRQNCIMPPPRPLLKSLKIFCDRLTCIEAVASPVNGDLSHISSSRHRRLLSTCRSKTSITRNQLACCQTCARLSHETLTDPPEQSVLPADCSGAVAWAACCFQNAA